MYRSPLHSSCFIVFSFVLLRPPCSTLFPYTTLFRSLEELSREVGESVSAAVLSGAEIVYVARVPTRRIMAVAITIGTRFPAAVTSMGRVLLAGLPEAEVEALLDAEPIGDYTDRTVTDRAELMDRLARV